MGIFDKTRDSLKKYGGMLVDTTETLAKQAKISLEINNLNEKIINARADLGEYILKKKESGKKTIELQEDYISQIDDKIKLLEKEIDEKRTFIASLKKKEAPSSSQDK